MTLHDLLPHWLADLMAMVVGVGLGLWVGMKIDPHRKDTNQ